MESSVSSVVVSSSVSSFSSATGSASVGVAPRSVSLSAPDSPLESSEADKLPVPTNNENTMINAIIKEIILFFIFFITHTPSFVSFIPSFRQIPIAEIME